MDEGIFYNNHYLTVDDRGRITDGWSDGPLPGKSIEGAVWLTDQGGYQFRLFPDGEENPALWTEDGIPLYKFLDGEAQPRTEEEIAADRAQIPPPPPTEQEKLRADIDFIMAMEDLL